MSKFAALIFAIAVLIFGVSPALACSTTTQQSSAALTDNALVNTANITNQANLANTVVYDQSNQQQNVVPQGPNLTVADTTQGTLTLIQNPSVNTGTVVNNVNQENKVFLGPEPTPTPTPAPTPAIKVNDYVALLITDGRSHARPGEQLLYQVKMRNNLPNDVSVSTLRVHIPTFVIPNPDNPNPIQGQAVINENPQARTIEFKNFNISADSEITFTIDTVVTPDAINGFELIANAQLNGDGIFQISEDKTIVQRLEAIAATQVVVPPQQTVQVAPVARPAVPVTAKTGAPAAALGVSPFMTLVGLLGLRRVLKK